MWCTGFRRVFRSRKWGRQIGQKLNVETGSRRRRNSEKNTGRHQPPPQAHFTSPNPPRPSRRSVSDGVIQLIFVFGAMLSLVQSIGLAREGLACENRRTQGLRFKERVRQVIFRYAPLEWFGKSTLGTCIWGGVKTDVAWVDLDPSDKQQMWNG